MFQLRKAAAAIAIIFFVLPLQADLWADQPDATDRSSEQIQQFWTWFSENKARFRNLEADRDTLMPEIVGHLGGLYQNVTIEIEPPKNGIRVMAISADGVKRDFSLVEHLVAAAPHFPDWKFIALRQPGDTKGVERGYGEATLNTSKMWIRPIEDEHGFHLIVFIPDFSAEKQNFYTSGTYILLDNSIGESNVAKDIRSLEFRQLPPADQRKGIIPFADLPKVFAAYQAKHSN